MSYEALDQGSNQLANYLIEAHKVQPGDRVGIYLDAEDNQLLSILGVLKAGATFVPMDRGLPASRTSFIVEDAALDIVLSGSQESDQTALASATLVDPKEALEGATTAAPSVTVSKDNIAYVGYYRYAQRHRGNPGFAY